MTLTKNMRRAKLFNSEKLYLSVQCPQEGTQVKYGRRSAALVPREFLPEKLAKCFNLNVYANASINTSSFKFTDTSVIIKHRTVDNLRSVAYRKKEKKKII